MRDRAYGDVMLQVHSIAQPSTCAPLTHHPFPCRMAAYLDVRAERHLRGEAIDGIQHRRHP